MILSWQFNILFRHRSPLTGFQCQNNLYMFGINKLLHGWLVCTIVIMPFLWKIAELTRSLRSLIRLAIFHNSCIKIVRTRQPCSNLYIFHVLPEEFLFMSNSNWSIWIVGINVLATPWMLIIRLKLNFVVYFLQQIHWQSTCCWTLGIGLCGYIKAVLH